MKTKALCGKMNQKDMMQDVQDAVVQDAVVQEEDVKIRKVAVHTRVSVSTKTKWDRFLLARHNTIRGTFGPELESAMLHYIRMRTSVPDEHVPKVAKTTFDALTQIAQALRMLPDYPLVKPIIVKSVIKNDTQYADRRTIAKYQKIIQLHSRDVQDPDEIFPRLDVTGFCQYVDKLKNESLVK